MDQSNPSWQNWKWQQQHVVSTAKDLQDYFTSINPAFFDTLFAPTQDKLKFQITPYLLSQIPPEITEEALRKHPYYLQFFPLGEIYSEGPDAYNGTDNWESPAEFPTSNLHHKYTNRALVRFRNCFGYCNFCFEALGTLEKNPAKEKLFISQDWEKSLQYLRDQPEIEEVVLSGGEPLLNSDSKLEKILKDISTLQTPDGKKKIRFKRIHTRVATFNPYRLTAELSKILAEYRVNEIAFNVAHPMEITADFEEAIGRLRESGGRYAPFIAAHTPLLQGINDNAEILWELFSRLYENNIKPYYLLHTMPHTPFADRQRVSVRKGVELMKTLKRHKSNIALPEYVIVHYDGKQTVPLEINGTPEFQYTQDEQGNPIVRFLNWKGKWVEYPDVKNSIKAL